MKKERCLSFIVGAVLFAVIFIFPEKFALGVKYGLYLCAETVIPSLFAFMCASTLAGCGEMPKPLKKYAALFMKLFSLPAEAFPAVLLGMLGGYPVGAKTAYALCSSGRITASQKERLTLFCVCPGVGFSVNAVGISMLSSKKAGLIILASVCLSALILGIFCGINAKSEEPVQTAEIADITIGEAVVKSVSSCASSMLAVSGFVALFSGIGEITALIPMNEKAKILLSCFLEVTGGCAAAAGKLPLPLIAGICAFGGICVHMQIISICGEPLNKIRFIFFRLLHCALSVLICIILLNHFPVELQTIEISKESFVLNSFSAPASVSLLFLSALIILDLDNEKRIC